MVCRYKSEEAQVKYCDFFAFYIWVMYAEEMSMNEQMSLFDLEPEQKEIVESGTLSIVRANFKDVEKVNWKDLFSGYSELYGITFSSGIPFMEKVFNEFRHIEMIFGCEGVMNSDIAAIISTQIKTVENLVKSKSTLRIAERIADGSIDIRVSRDTKSHEKIFILKADDGKVRVITGSANMSASAFLGIQRENIIVFDDMEAYEYYKERFDDFKEVCSDSVTEKVMLATNEDIDYIRDNISEVPILQTVEQKKMVILEPQDDTTEVEIVADVKGLESEIKPLLPRIRPENEKIIFTGEAVKGFRRKYQETANVRKSKEKKLPKLHVDYDSKELYFNGKKLDINPSKELISQDVSCLINFIGSLSSFHGNYKKSQADYYKFLNWYFCSLFMPYLRYIAYKNEYSVTSFPVMGILYGDSNGGKTTFIKLLSKLMTGVKIPANSSSDFTGTNINNLKCACEGVPINIDDLAKAQYDAHFEKVIKDDSWGILEHYINYPSVVISTNKLASLKPDISKRVVTCRIDIKIDKEMGVYNSKKINENMKQASNSLYCEYVRRMLEIVDEMTALMKDGDDNYFPDIFAESSRVLREIIEESSENVPEYVRELTYSDYFGDLAIGKYAIERIKTAWQTEPKMFSVDKKNNKLIYTYPESGRLYELRYFQEELPPSLEAQVTARSLVMKLDVAQEVFGELFKKRLRF